MNLYPLFQSRYGVSAAASYLGRRLFYFLPEGMFGNRSMAVSQVEAVEGDMPLRALLYRRPAEPKAIQVVHDKNIYLVRVRRHRQARRYTLRIQAATREVVLTMPPRGCLKEAREFAQKHGGWIASRLHHLPAAEPFAHGGVVPLRGQPHRIVHRKGERGTVWVETGDDGERRLCVAGEVPHIDRRVGDFLRKEARRDLEQASRALAQKLGVSVKTVSIRDPSSRWGSCSTTGVLSYSWRLILAPPFVLDYLAAHEVAHLVEMNHSQRFWRVVDRLCPNVRRAKAWLDMHGPELHRYGSPRARIEPDVPVDGRRQPRR